MIEILCGLGAIIVGLFIKGSFQSSKIEKLENEVEANNALNTIEAAMNKAEVEAEKAKNEYIAEQKSKSWRDRIGVKND